MRALLCGRCLLLAGLLVAAVLPSSALAKSAASIKGVGAGKTAGDVFQFELSAHAEHKPTTPENGFGQVKVQSATAGTLYIDVRCVFAVAGLNPAEPVGNARISGMVTERSSNPALAGQNSDRGRHGRGRAI